MSIKVVHGIIGETRKDPAKNSQIQNQVNNQSIQTNVLNSQYSQLITNEAVSVSVKHTRVVGSTDKIKEYKLAREVADNVADKVKSYSDSAGGAHTGLSEATGKPHLV